LWGSDTVLRFEQPAIRLFGLRAFVFLERYILQRSSLQTHASEPMTAGMSESPDLVPKSQRCIGFLTNEMMMLNSFSVT
jgi:hypothetical protein